MASWKKDSSGNWKKSGSSKKNYTIIDGKKVEKTEERSTPSESWNKDKVTLEEAKQQTKDVEDRVVSVEAPANATTTEYTNDKGEVIATKVETTTYEPIKVGSDIKSAAQTPATTTTKITGNKAAVEAADSGKDYYVTGYYEAPAVEPEAEPERVLTPEQNKKLNVEALNTPYTTKQQDLSSSTTATNSMQSNYDNGVTLENILKGEGAVGKAVDKAAGAYDYVANPVKKAVVSSINAADITIDNGTTEYNDPDIKSSFLVDTRKTPTNVESINASATKVSGAYVGAVETGLNATKKVLDSGTNPVAEGTIETPEPTIKASETIPAKITLGAAEAIATIPVAVPAFAAAVLSNPVRAGESLVVDTADDFKADPATAVGHLVGIYAGGKVLGKMTGSKSKTKVPETDVASKASVDTALKFDVNKGSGGINAAKSNIKSVINDIKTDREVTANVAKLNEFKSTPEAIKQMPDVNNPVIKLEMPEIAQIKSPESFKLKNTTNKDISSKQSLDNTKKPVNRNTIAKIEKPESAPNYAKNIAELNKFKNTEVAKSTPSNANYNTGSFFDRVENPQFRATDKLSHTRPRADTIEAPKPTKPAIDIRPDVIAKEPTTAPEVLKNFDPTDNIGYDSKGRFTPDVVPKSTTEAPSVLKNFDKEPSSIGYDKKGRFKPDELKGYVDNKTMLENEIADAHFQREYFQKKNMQRFFEDEQGASQGRVFAMDWVDSAIETIHPKNRPAIIDRIIEDSKPKGKSSIQKEPTVSELARKSNKEDLVPSLKEQLERKSKQISIPKSRQTLVPYSLVEYSQKQYTEQLPEQTVTQQQSYRQIQQQEQVQSQQLAQKQKIKLRTPPKVINKDVTKEPIKENVNTPVKPKPRVRMPKQDSIYIDTPNKKKKQQQPLNMGKFKVKKNSIKNVFKDPTKMRK